MTAKILSDYNQRDIYTFFMKLYKEKHGIDYRGVGFINDEMQLIRKAIEENGAAQIVCATINCIEQNNRSVTIRFFIAGLKYYVTPYPPVVYWAVKQFADNEIKKLWRKFEILDSVWLPRGSQNIERTEILNELKKWANAKNKSKKKRKTNTKTKPKTNV